MLHTKLQNHQTFGSGELDINIYVYGRGSLLGHAT